MPAGFLPAFCPYECGATFPIEDPAINPQGGRRSNRDLATLIQWIASSFVLEVPHQCRRKRAPVLLFTSWAAIDVLQRFLTGGTQRIHCERMDALLAEWVSQAHAFSRLLDSVAGSGRSELARHVRYSETIIRNDAHLLDAARPVLCSRDRQAKRRAEAAAKLSGIEGGLELARDFLLAPLLGKLGLPETLRSTLIEPRALPLAGIAEREVIYLARTGTAPFRAIAAHRLAGGESRQVVATLQQLLFDSDVTTALIALDSLCLMRPDSLDRVLESSADGFRDTQFAPASLVALAIEFKQVELKMRSGAVRR